MANEAVSKPKLYIVYMGEHSYPDSDSVISSNYVLLASVVGSISQAKEATTHHYHKSFRGFSAVLTPEQAQTLRETESVISVFESKIARLHTTHSWNFLGIDAIPQNNKLKKMETKLDVIIGVIDSGVWPESESFNDRELGPKPNFKGECVTGNLNNQPFKCNKKIIGARYYSKGFEVAKGPLESQNQTFFRSPRDNEGHGTHTASTIAGSEVNLTLFDSSKGVTRGGMPSARLAIYKACWLGLCDSADVLSAFHDAIQDGVHIISISAGTTPTSFFTDICSIGSYHAFKEGILVSAAAGNGGTIGTVANVAPWTLTVAASTIDREFNSNVQLGNSAILKGSSINPLQVNTYYGLIDGSTAAAVNVAADNA
ncbi:hypothetical protein MKW94_030947, partial [Papaver nudicaule]|nr:hypothetical protein [Papaver nudicaule]